MNSIQSRLLWGIGLCTLLAWAGIGLTSYQLERQQLHKAFDAELQAAAELVLDISTAGISEPEISGLLQRHSASNRGNNSRQHGWNIWFFTDQQLANAPATLSQLIRLQPASRVGEFNYQDLIWRYATTGTADRHVIVAEPLTNRDRVIHDAALKQAIPLLLFLPLCLLGCLIIIRHGLFDLERLSKNLRQHNASQLNDIQLNNPSRELVPVLDALNSLFQQLSDALEREAGFTANAAHEMRTPLAAIRTQAEVALASDEQQREHAIRQIIRASDRLQHLMNQLLMLAKIESAGFSSNKQLKVSRLIGELIDDFQSSRAHSGLDIEVQCSESLCMLADAATLRIALDNLLRNAMRYANKTILISAIAEQDRVVLSISDDGPGLKTELMPKAAGRFFRSPDSKGSGSGLGLSIVERIARLHRGRLILDESQALGGLQARLEFPQNRTTQALASSASQRS